MCETTLAQAAAPGDTKLVVSSDSGVKPGQTCVIDSGIMVECRGVAALGSIILDKPLERPHPQV